MQYDIIAIDMFNLFYKLKNSSFDKDPISIARNIVRYIKESISPHLIDTGKLYLLYDPIPKNDLGISKTFKYTERQKILHAYKKNRVHDKNCLIIVDFVRKYFLHRGKNIITVISNKYEADDFVESILKEASDDLDKKYPDGGHTLNVALVTTDEDFCRYLN